MQPILPQWTQLCTLLSNPLAIGIDKLANNWTELKAQCCADGFSRPGKPTDNAFIEALNGRFRQECLNENWFLSLAKTLQW